MAIRRKTPVPLAVADLVLLEAIEDELLDWIEAGKGPFVVKKADHPDTPAVVWSELVRSARNTGWNAIENDVLVMIEAVEPED